MKKNISIFGIAASILFALAINLSVSAAPQPNEIQISPSKSDVLELDPGDVKTGSFRVANIGTNTFTFKIEVTPFSVTNEFYDSNFDLVTNYNKMTDWITYTIDKDTLEPGESTMVNYTVTAPEDIPGGSQCAALAASVVNSSEGTIVIVGRVAHVIYARVNGETRLEGSVLENNIPGFFLSSPVSVSSLVENTGNIDFEAKYNFEVMEAFSDEEVYSNTDQEVTYRILPETKRFINFSWDGSPQLGLFRVRQTVTVNDKVSVNEKLVFLCPVWLLFLVIFGVIFMIIWLFVRSRARRRQL